MKNLFTWCFLFVCFQTISQTPKLTLSTDFPEPGQEITFTYEGRLVNENSVVDCMYFHVPNTNMPIFGVPFSIVNNKIIGKFTPPDTSTYFFIRISNNKDIETNNDQGYGFNLYKDKKLIPGTLLAQGYSMKWLSYFYNVKNDPEKGIQLMEKEFELNPEMKEIGESFYIEFLAQNTSTKSKGYALAKEKIEKILTTGEGEKRGYFYAGVLANWDFKVRDSLIRDCSFKCVC